MSRRVHLLVDGNNIVAINAHAYPRLTSRRGFPTGGVYGTLKMLRYIVMNEIEDQIASVHFVFDAGRPAFRRETVPTYKTKRESKERSREDEAFHEGYRRQLRTIPKLLLPLGVHVSKADGWEADDLLAGLAKRQSEDGHRVVVVSGDKDLIQLVGKRVSVYKPSAHEIVETKPPGYLLGRCLTGDPSDDIPGVGGIGAKKAADIIAYLREHDAKLTPGGLLALMEAQGEAFPSYKQMGQDDRRERLRANWEVMNLRRTGDAALAAAEVRRGRFRPARFRRLCAKYDFKSVLTQYDVWVRPFRDIAERSA